MNISILAIGLVCLGVFFSVWALIKVYRYGVQVGRSREEREWIIHWMIDRCEARTEKFFQEERAERKMTAEASHS